MLEDPKGVVYFSIFRNSGACCVVTWSISKPTYENKPKFR